MSFKSTLYMLLFLSFMTGCVERNITVLSAPVGANCEINGRDIGKTPAKFKYIENGKFRLTLKLEGYEELHTGFRVKKNWQDMFVLDFFAEIIPYKMHKNHQVEFELLPIKKISHDEFLKEIPNKLKTIKTISDHE